MKKAARWIVLAIMAVIPAIIAVIILGATAGGSSHGSTNSTHGSGNPAQGSSNLTSSTAAVAPGATSETTTGAQPRPKAQQATTAGIPKSGRCGDITVNRHTSCAFARIVVNQYDAHPSSSFLARSPVTGLTYAMHCEQAHGVVACDDNSTSTLAFNGPPPTP